MNICILGTGGVGQAFATKLESLGHKVIMGTREIAVSREKLADFFNQHPAIKLKTFAEAAAAGDLVILVTKGAVTADVVKAAGSANLKGKIVIDITNPLDFSKGMPPSLIPELSNTHSLGEEIQHLLPDSFVVKTLNTMWNGLMLNPRMLADGDHINYISGNHAESKSKVIDLLLTFGWKKENILDLGDISAAKATEAVLPIWLRLYGVKQSAAFNFKLMS